MLAVTIVVCTLLVVGVTPSYAATMSGGWHEPVPLNNPAAGWLASGCSGNSGYIAGRYHIGVDYWRPAGSAVYAIGDGVVAAKHNWGNGYGDALYIRHRAADGSQFIAVYGHISSWLAVNGTVSAGAHIASIAHINGPHLHFGIRPGTHVPNSSNGNMPCSSWQSTNGYVNPMPYLNAHPRSGATQYTGWIVQWNGDTKTQKTAWLVGRDGKRRWIDSVGRYNCLRSVGAPGPRALPAATLNALPDQAGQVAPCPAPRKPSVGYQLRAYEGLPLGGKITAKNGKCTLVHQWDDGNTVLYHRSGRPLWATNDTSRKTGYMVFQPDGNFVGYDQFGKTARWATNTYGRGADRIVMQDDCNLVVYSGNKPLWATNTVVR